MDTLGSVSCASSKACVAVGEYVQRIDYDPVAMKSVPMEMPLVEGWNGVRWSLLPFPGLPTGGQQGSLEGALDAVSCTSSSACMIVGVGNWGRFADWWDGTSWSPAVSIPAPVGASGAGVEALSCLSRSFCMVVGEYSQVSGGYQTLAERWDGSSWSVEPTPEVAAALLSQLTSVSCTSPSACTAVGDYFDAPGHDVGLAERWNGTSWSVQRTPNPRGNSNQLGSVSCTSGRACVAVGGTTLNPGVYQPLVERWDDTSWSLEPTPRGVNASLGAVSCTSREICMAIGAGPRQAVAEQSAPAAAKLTGIPAGCTSGPFTVHVTGAGITSVVWSLDGRKIKGHTLQRGTHYAASIRLSPGRHEFATKVKFTPSSHTHPHTFRRSVLGCSPAQ